MTTPMTLDQIIALSASLAACASAVATFLTIRQMAQQRKASFRPELAFSTTHFEGSATTDEQLPNNWVAWTHQSESRSNQRELVIPLHNVGLGAAREISLSWSFPIDRAVEEVNALAQQALVPAYLKFEKGMLSITSDNLSNWTSIWRNQQKIFLDFVLPASVPQEALVIRLPNAYIQLCSSLAYFATRIEKRSTFPSFPLLTAQLEYQDIGGSRHEASFEFTVEIEAIIGKAKEMHGVIVCKKIA